MLLRFQLWEEMGKVMKEAKEDLVLLEEETEVAALTKDTGQRLTASTPRR